MQPSNMTRRGAMKVAGAVWTGAAVPVVGTALAQSAEDESADPKDGTKPALVALSQLTESYDPQAC